MEGKKLEAKILKVQKQPYETTLSMALEKQAYRKMGKQN